MFNGATLKMAVADAPAWLRVNRPAWMSTTSRYASPNATPPSPNAVGTASETIRNPAMPPSNRSW